MLPQCPQEKREFIRARVLPLCRHFDQREGSDKLEKRYSDILTAASDATVQDLFDRIFAHVHTNYYA